MRKAALHNLGCKVNAYETEAMQQLLENAGYEIVPFHETADVYVINTCSVTNMADRKSRQMIHRARKQNPQSIAVYGLGVAARAFMMFYTAIYRHPITVKILKYKDQAERFIDKFGNNPLLHFEICTSLEELFQSDIIVSCVSYANNELCPADIYPKGCTIVPVHTAGFQNCDLVFDRIIVDDVNHVMKYRYYEQFKDRMVRITDVVNKRVAGRSNDKERILVYNGGIALHDMYWAMKIEQKIGDDCPKIPMSYPTDRFWL